MAGKKKKVDGWINENSRTMDYKTGWMGGCTNQKSRWMDGCTNEKVDGWIIKLDGCTNDKK